MSPSLLLAHLLLQLNAGVEAEVGLLCEIVDVEDDFDEGSLGDKGPGLLDLATEHAQILPVRYVRLCVAVHDLRAKGGIWTQEHKETQEKNKYQDI